MKCPHIHIGNRRISSEDKPIIFAEIGINHNGDLNTALKMVDAAKRAGVEIVKHQTHIPDKEMSPEALKSIPGNSDQSIYKIIEDCMLTEEEEIKLQRYVHEQGMTFISTPFSREAAYRLNKMNVPAFKIGSGECNNLPLLEELCQFKKPIILSTGMLSLESIKDSVEILRVNNIPYALMHCTSIYPTPYDQIRLKCIDEIREAYPDAVLGLSDHSLSNIPCLGAVARGASILERHFTDHKDRPGPDIPISMDEKECADLIVQSEEMFLCNTGGKGPLKDEQVTMDFAFSTVVSLETAIKKDACLSKDNLWVKRPGTGEIPASRYKELTSGHYFAKEDIPPHTHLGESMFYKK